MGLLKKVLRPIYRRFFKKPLWSFLSKVKVFFIADFVAEIEPKLAAIEARNVAQWKALEQLLLAVIRLPERRADVVTLSRASRSEEPEDIATKRDGIRSEE
jgi:hypothetical protein